MQCLKLLQLHGSQAWLVTLSSETCPFPVTQTMLIELCEYVCLFLSIQKSGASGKKAQKTTQEESDSEDEYSPESYEDDEDEHAEEHPPPPATASWSSDHNYIAVTPEKTTPLSPTVLNKKCMYLFEDLGLLLKPHCCSSSINVVPVVLTSFRNDHYIWERTWTHLCSRRF